MEKLTLGDRIKFIRKELHLTQSEFGAKVNPPATKGAVSRWESDTSIPTDERLKQIAKMSKIAKLGYVTVDYLKTGRIDKNEFLDALYQTKRNNKPSRILDNDGFEQALSYAMNTRAIEIRSSEAIEKLTNNHYKRFKELSIHSKKALLEVIKLIDLFEKSSFDKETNEYSSRLAELLSQISIYTQRNTTKNKNATHSALNNLLDSFDPKDF